MTGRKGKDAAQRSRDRLKDGLPFPVDPTVKMSARGGGAPPGHPRRCQALNKYGDQCGRFAEPGRNFCRFHGGRTPLVRKSAMSRYAKSVSKSLAERLKQLSEESPDERASLADEVDVSRMLAERAMRVFDAVVVQEKENSQGVKPTPEQKALAIQAVRSAMDSTADLVSKMARVSALTSDKVTFDQIAFVVAQFGQILEAEIKDPELRAKLQKRIDNINIPENVQLNPRVGLDFGD